MRVKEVLETANAKFLQNGIDNYFYETRELLAFTLGKSKEWLMINFDYDISDEEYEKFYEFVNLRIHGEPFQYILGKQYFMGLEFFVNKNVLIPRADTEILVYKILGICKDKRNIKILDMCTGSGCIAVSLAKNLEDAKIFATDISEEAISIACKNSDLNETKVDFFKSNLFENVPNEKFDIIVSNPPYISSEEMKTLSEDVLKEPELALNGGQDGLHFYREISKCAVKFLSEGGMLAFEIGYKQGEDVKNILTENGYKNIEIFKDYSSNDRVVIAKNRI